MLDMHIIHIFECQTSRFIQVLIIKTQTWHPNLRTAIYLSARLLGTNSKLSGTTQARNPAS